MADDDVFVWIVFIVGGALTWHYYHPDTDKLIERAEKVCIAHMTEGKLELKGTGAIACKCQAERLSYILSEDQYKKYVDALWDTVSLNFTKSVDTLSFFYEPIQYNAVKYFKPHYILRYGTTNDQKERLEDATYACAIIEKPTWNDWTFFLTNPRYVKQAQELHNKLNSGEAVVDWKDYLNLNSN